MPQTSSGAPAEQWRCTPDEGIGHARVPVVRRTRRVGPLLAAGSKLDEIKAARHGEAAKAAPVLGAELVAFDVGDYPILETPDTGPTPVR